MLTDTPLPRTFIWGIACEGGISSIYEQFLNDTLSAVACASIVCRAPMAAIPCSTRCEVVVSPMTALRA